MIIPNNQSVRIIVVVIGGILFVYSIYGEIKRIPVLGIPDKIRNQLKYVKIIQLGCVVFSLLFGGWMMLLYQPEKTGNDYEFWKYCALAAIFMAMAGVSEALSRFLKKRGTTL